MRKPKFQTEPLPFVSEILLTAEQLQAIGCLTIEASRLESLIEFIIVKFDQHKADIFVHGRLTIGPKIIELRKLLSPLLNEPSEKESFKDTPIKSTERGGCALKAYAPV